MIYFNIVGWLGLYFPEPQEGIIYLEEDGWYYMYSEHIPWNTMAIHSSEGDSFDDVEGVYIYISEDREKIKGWMDGVKTVGKVLKEFIHI